MSARIIDGKIVSAQIKAEVKEETAKIIKTGKTPTLAVIIVGDDPASKVYVKNKQKACEEVSIKSQSYELPEDITQKELLELIDTLNKSNEVNGILVQHPLPKQLNEDEAFLAIDPLKDVDCFHPYNVGLLGIGKPRFLPCTPAGIIELLKRYNIEISGKRCVILGRSNIVGKPISQLLLMENGTVTICHSKTENLSEITKEADILVAAIGKPRFVTADMIKDRAVVVDVGIHRLEGKKLCGDVNFDVCVEKASAITPVPGGVGVMTIAMLLKNCIKAFEIQNK